MSPSSLPGQVGTPLVSLLEFPVARMKEIVSALLLALDSFLIRSELPTLGYADSFCPFGINS